LAVDDVAVVVVVAVVTEVEELAVALFETLLW
jgi:hypothetical protein